MKIWFVWMVLLGSGRFFGWFWSVLVGFGQLWLVLVCLVGFGQFFLLWIVGPLRGSGWFWVVFAWFWIGFH